MNQELEIVPAQADASSLATRYVSEVTREALLAVRSAETRRVCAMHVEAIADWLERDLLEATPIDVANYLAGPGAGRQRLQSRAPLTRPDVLPRPCMPAYAAR